MVEEEGGPSMPLEQNHVNNFVQLNIDEIDEILKRCDVDTVMKCLRLNSKVNALIMNRRHFFARATVNVFTLEKDLYMEGNPWRIELQGFRGREWVTDLTQEMIRSMLCHVLPIRLQFKYDKDVVVDEDFGESVICKDWVHAIKKVAFMIKNPAAIEGCYNFLKRFTNIVDLEIRGYTNTERLGEFLDLMPEITSLRLSFQESDDRRQISSDDNDLEILIRKSKNLKCVWINGVTNCYNVETFIRFLQNANFAKYARIFMRNWPSTAPVFHKWVTESTEIKMATFISKPRLELPTYPHRYEFTFRDCEFMVTFEMDAF